MDNKDNTNKSAENLKTNKASKKSTKETIMDILKDNSNKHISGEFISEKIGVSRASVWKGIKSLQKEGFDIESKTGSGYKLIGKKDHYSTSKYDIKHNLSTKYIGQNIEYFDTIDSTNTYANKIASNAPEGTVVVSDEQTNGKGRTGKQWISKQKEGVYLSIILKPNIPITDATFLTQVAGASLLKSLEKLGVSSRIKWPNDIVVNSKKICGILTEMSAEIDRISYIIVGIGINLYNKEFDKNIKNSATSLELEGYRIDKENLLKTYFETFEMYYEDFKNGNRTPILNILKDYSAVLGREIFIIRDNEKEQVFAENIDEYGNLIVRSKFGFLETIFTGEISIRGLDSYI